MQTVENNQQITKKMFTINLYDRTGNELNIGDIVAVSDGRRFNFYAEVKYLEKENAIAPFHTFSFHSFIKVDKVPEGAVLSTEERYRIWWLPGETKEIDEDAKNFQDYLMSWRQCEHLLGSCYKVFIPDSKPALATQKALF